MRKWMAMVVVAGLLLAAITGAVLGWRQHQAGRQVEVIGTQVKAASRQVEEAAQAIMLPGGMTTKEWFVLGNAATAALDQAVAAVQGTDAPPAAASLAYLTSAQHLMQRLHAMVHVLGDMQAFATDLGRAEAARRSASGAAKEQAAAELRRIEARVDDIAQKAGEAFLQGGTAFRAFEKAHADLLPVLGADGLVSAEAMLDLKLALSEEDAE